MKTLTFGQLRKENEEKRNSILTNNGVFFAFNTEQFNEGKAKLNLQEGDKIVSIGLGGYMPKTKVDKFLKEMEDLNTEFRKYIIDNNLKDTEILYHLSNHECFYTGDIEYAINATNGIYSYEEVSKVYRKYYVEYSE
jgi:hypothetical protein